MVGFATNYRCMERANQFVGQSLAFLDAVERASRAAPLNRPVLVIGERGTGKELIAERLHHLSPRWSGPLVIMNCAALPENLIEAELFGHEAGSFTGAAKTRHGRFEEADGGTLVPGRAGDPILAGAGPAAARGRIWRDHPHRRVQADQVDVRIVAATNENLPNLVDKGKFRADLLDRLSFEVVTLAAAARAERATFRLLAEHFGRRMAVELEWPNWPGFSAAAVAELEAYHWPGNVRELRNVVERAVYRWEDPERQIDAIQFDPFHSPWAPTAGSSRRMSRLRGRRIDADRVHRKSRADRIRSASATTNDFRAAVADYERALLEDALAAQPVQSARHGDGARPQLRPAPSRAEASQAPGNRRAPDVRRFVDSPLKFRGKSAYPCRGKVRRLL